MKSKLADQDGRRSKMMTQFLRHVTSSAHYAGVKRNSFRRTIYPLSLMVIALMLLKSPPPPPHHKAQGRKKTRLNRVKDISGCGYCSIVHFSFAILPTNQWMIPSVVTVMAFHLFSGSFTSQERMYVLIGDRTGHSRKLREVLKICKGRNKGSTFVLSYLRSVATTHSLLPLGCKLNLPLSGPRNWLYRDDATMEKSGIWPLSMPRGEKHSLGIPCK